MIVIYKLVMKISTLFDFFFILTACRLAAFILLHSSKYSLVQKQLIMIIVLNIFWGVLGILTQQHSDRHTNTKNTLKEPKVRKSVLLAKLQNFKNLSSNGLGSEMLFSNDSILGMTCGRKLGNKDKLICENCVPMYQRGIDYRLILFL